MAVYGNERQQGFSVNDVKFVSTMDIPVLDMRYMQDLNKQQKGYFEEDTEKAQENFGKLQDYQDEILGVKVDNEGQRVMLENMKKEYGIDASVFSQFDFNSLKSPYATRGIGNKLKQITADPRFQKIVTHKVIGDDFASKIKDIADPNLRRMAAEEYAKYKNSLDGNYDINALSIADYKDVDIDKLLIEIAKDSPETKTEVVKTSNGKVYTEQVIQRDSEFIDQMIIEAQNNPIVKRNLIAKGYMNPDGTVTTKFAEKLKYVKQAFTKPSTDIGTLYDINIANDSPKGQAAKNPFTTAGQERESALWSDLKNYGIDISDSVIINAQQEADAAQGIAQISKGKTGDEASLDKLEEEFNELPANSPTRKMGKVWITKEGNQFFLNHDAIDRATGKYVPKKIPLTQAQAAAAQSSNQQPVDTADMAQTIGYLESGDSYTAKNADSTARGRYQFIDSTGLEIAQELGIAKTKEEYLEKMKDPTFQDKLFERQSEKIKKDSDAIFSILNSDNDKMEIAKQRIAKAAGLDSIEQIPQWVVNYLRHHQGSAQSAMNYLTGDLSTVKDRVGLEGRIREGFKKFGSRTAPQQTGQNRLPEGPSTQRIPSYLN